MFIVECYWRYIPSYRFGPLAMQRRYQEEKRRARNGDVMAQQLLHALTKEGRDERVLTLHIIFIGNHRFIFLFILGKR